MHANDNNDNDGRPTELNGLPREMTPPSALRDRVERDLRRRGMVITARPRYARLAATVLFPLLCAAAGFGAGWFSRPIASATIRHDDRQPHFILLLYGGTDSPTDNGVREYGDWARRVAATGADVSGEKLADESGVLVGAPIGSSAGADLRGFFIVQAEDASQAQLLAVSHPHVKRGGTIVVRRIDPT
jgi:hypothetical protein